MKIILIHGDNVDKAYRQYQIYLDKAKNKNWEIIFIDLKKSTFSESIISKSLFTNKTLHILLNANQISDKDAKWLKVKQKDLDNLLIIYNEGNVNKTKLKGIKIQKEEKFELPKYIWKFLDSFYPGNSKDCIKLFYNTIENEHVEFVFSLISKTLKDLYLIKIDKEALPYPGWRVEKLKRQSDKFNKSLLKDIINDFAHIDIKVKTSRSNLTDLLDFSISTKLE